MNQKKQPETSSDQIGFHIHPGAIAWKLELIAIIMAVISLITHYFKYIIKSEFAAGLIPIVGFDTELSIPSLYAVFLLFGAAALLVVIAILKKEEKAPYTAQWFVLAAGFLYLAFDEGASIHELLMDPVGSLMGENMPRVFYFAWIVPALLVVTLAGLFFVKFLTKLPGKTRRGFLIGALLYLAGTIGFEMISGKFASLYGIRTFGFSILTTIEEMLEFSGTIFFIHALLAYLSEYYPLLRLKIKR